MDCHGSNTLFTAHCPLRVYQIVNDHFFDFRLYKRLFKIDLTNKLRESIKRNVETVISTIGHFPVPLKRDILFTYFRTIVAEC